MLNNNRTKSCGGGGGNVSLVNGRSREFLSVFYLTWFSLFWTVDSCFLSAEQVSDMSNRHFDSQRICLWCKDSISRAIAIRPGTLRLHLLHRRVTPELEWWLNKLISLFLLPVNNTNEAVFIKQMEYKNVRAALFYFKSNQLYIWKVSVCV